ncbi:MAG: TolC family protein, partial [Planctomycetota bacterium]|nr:TolC family protein [Planctomycetota bacterium]
MKAFTTIAICALCLSGCRTSPTPPTKASTEIPESHDWSQELDYGLSTKPGDLSEWWKELGDPLLNRLIAASLKQNLDLQQGASRIREARAQRGIAEASRFPTLKTSGSAQKSKTGEAPASEVFAAGFDATWELDVFGRVSKSIEAADADLAAVKESYYDLRISLLAEVALNYIEVRSFQNRLAIARENLKAQQETYRIAKARFDAKITSELDVKQAETNFLNTQSGIPPLEAGLKRAMNRLAVLLGRKPGALGKELSKKAPIPVGPPAIA